MKTAQNLTAIEQVPGARVAIIQSKWHRDITDLMVAKCRRLLEQNGVTAIEAHVISGCLELPLAAKRLIESNRQRGTALECVIAFGVIVKGDTDHYEVVRDQTMTGLSQVSLALDTPVINEILPVTNIQHARDRGADNEFNKGVEAAVAALETMAWRRKYPLPR